MHKTKALWCVHLKLWDKLWAVCGSAVGQRQAVNSALHTGQQSAQHTHSTDPHPFPSPQRAPKCAFSEVEDRGCELGIYLFYTLAWKFVLGFIVINVVCLRRYESDTEYRTDAGLRCRLVSAIMFSWSSPLTLTETTHHACEQSTACLEAPQHQICNISLNWSTERLSY